MKAVSGNIKKIFVIILLLISQYIQVHYFQTGILKNNLWNLPLAATSSLMLIALLITLFSGWQAGEADTRGQIRLSVFWLAVATLMFPWSTFLFYVVIRLLL